MTGSSRPKVKLLPTNRIVVGSAGTAVEVIPARSMTARRFMEAPSSGKGPRTLGRLGPNVKYIQMRFTIFCKYGAAASALLRRGRRGGACDARGRPARHPAAAAP